MRSNKSSRKRKWAWLPFRKAETPEVSAFSVARPPFNTAGEFDPPAGGDVYNGFRRYHAGCNHCHGPDGMGSTIGPPLVDHLPGKEVFVRTVMEGMRDGTSIMKGFADDPNVAPYVSDIYAYLKARANGTVGRGRPTRQHQ